MQITMKCQPSYSAAFCVLAQGEALQVERGAMLAMSPGVEVTGGIGSGGVARAVMRKVAGGESFFVANYKALIHNAWVAVAPAYPGDMAVLELTGQPWIIQQGAFVAASSTVQVDVRYAGLQSVLLKEGITSLRAAGEGQCIVGSYGGLIPFTLQPREEMIVDTGHLAAFTEGIDLKLGVLGGVVGSQVSGEGLVARLVGPGRIYIQTRAEQSLGSWLQPDRWQNRGS